MSIAAVLLAAGAGTRFMGATHKLRAPFRGSTVVQHALAGALEARLDATYVVVGAVELRDLIPEGVIVVQNHSWELGQATSLRAGVFVAENDGHDAVVVGLGDQPLIGAGVWQVVAQCSGDLVTAVFGDSRSPPVKLGAAVWPLLPISGDAAARVLMQMSPERVMEVLCEGEPIDFDTLEDLKPWG
ncbi:MAG: NTP transferase domain-containing protein [Acidimicrobiia bacterium]|nr:NTP transferase domain-containing protein [Acidimicrobiia bacterium]MYC57248.1 NTP transferase domain-containing protein [Acidimicrobiia bacterium]MYG94452.1 NTP transferase domain-containing protein [Acidimicrobiia bacterium]MYI30962.1 NTP transferase domain-containing protein [Acidimicrobiia bacterium]